MKKRENSVKKLADYKSKSIRIPEIDKSAKPSPGPIVSPLTKKGLKIQQSGGELKSLEESDNSENEDGDNYDGKSRKSMKIQGKPKKSLSAVDQMAAIFSKPLEEREKSDKDKIV